MNECVTTLAGQCTSWSSLRVIMVTILGTAAILMLDRWWMEARR